MASARGGCTDAGECIPSRGWTARFRLKASRQAITRPAEHCTWSRAIVGLLVDLGSRYPPGRPECGAVWWPRE